MIRFGVHCSLRDGLPGALREAKRIGCESMQIFTRSPRVWKMRIPSPEEVSEFLSLRTEFGIHPLIVHTPYLPNLATSNKALYRMSLQCLQDDLTIAQQLKADYLVIHPGSYSQESSVEEGIATISRAINKVLNATPGDTMILLENAAGGGRRLASSAQELADMMAGIRDKRRIGVCFDTAHAFGAGYDLSNAKGIKATLNEFDRIVGLSSIKVIHFNDSIVELGSRKDRHQHLGKGCIGAEGFARFVRLVKDIVPAGILETPKDTPASDSRNLKLLFRWRKEA